MPAKRKTALAYLTRTAALLYGGLSLLAAVAFLLVTTFTGDYPPVARYGGAAWVFLLLMIILMPVVIPWVQKRGKKPPEPPTVADTEPPVSCVIESPPPQTGESRPSCP